MARIETDPNYVTPTFSRATEPTDLVQLEDIQGLAAALSAHDHANGRGLAVTRLAGSTSLDDPLLLSQALRTSSSQNLPAVATSAGKWRYYKATAAITITKNVADGGSPVWGPGATAGATSFSLGVGDSVAVYCDGSTWTVY